MVAARWLGRPGRALEACPPLLALAVTVTACGHDEALPGQRSGDVPGAGGGAHAGSAGAFAATGGASAGAGAGPSAGASGAAGSGGMPAEIVFAEDHELEYHATIAAADLEHLEERGNDEVYVPASLVVRGGRVGELDLGRVGIRHKGSYTLHHCWDEFGGVRSYGGECAKLSYKFDFAEYQEDTRLFGLKKLNLHAASGDATKLRELLGYGMFRDFGVDAPRVAPAGLFINGSYAGVFLAVEEIDGRYTAFHFPEGGDGNLYKEIWPRAGLEDAHFQAALETNEEVSDVSDMQGFAAAVAGTSSVSFERDMQAWVDLERLLRYIAVDRASKNWDGIMSFYSPVTPHNFYWYRDDGPAPRFHLIPWDLDNTFWQFDPYMAPEQWVTADPVPDFNERPAHCQPRAVWDPGSGTSITPPGCDPLLRLLASTQWDRLVSLGQELLAGPFDLSVIEPKLDAWEARLRPLIEGDPTLDVSSWRGATADFRSILARDRADFESFLAEGYHDEVVEPPLPEPTAEELAEPLPESGIVTDRVNNYEFVGGAAATAPAGTLSFGGPGSASEITWNTQDALAGSADLRFGFSFTRQPGAWDEWTTLLIGSAGGLEQDISAFRQISITLRADRERRVRIRLNSPAYEGTFGGAWSEFGSDFTVPSSPVTIKLRLDQIYYPEWARQAWSAGQGWDADEAALALVLQTFTGLLFAPAPTTDGGGEMLSALELGFLQIDNIYFQ